MEVSRPVDPWPLQLVYPFLIGVYQASSFTQEDEDCGELGLRHSIAMKEGRGSYQDD